MSNLETASALTYFFQPSNQKNIFPVWCLFSSWNGRSGRIAVLFFKFFGLIKSPLGSELFRKKELNRSFFWRSSAVKHIQFKQSFLNASSFLSNSSGDGMNKFLAFVPICIIFIGFIFFLLYISSSSNSVTGVFLIVPSSVWFDRCFDLTNLDMAFQSNFSISSYKEWMSGFVDWNLVKNISESVAKKKTKDRYCSVDSSSKIFFILVYLAVPWTVDLNVDLEGKNTRKYCFKFSYCSIKRTRTLLNVTHLVVLCLRVYSATIWLLLRSFDNLLYDLQIVWKRN